MEAFLSDFVNAAFFDLRGFRVWFAFLSCAVVWFLVNGGKHAGFVFGAVFVVRFGFWVLSFGIFVMFCFGLLAVFDFCVSGEVLKLIRLKKVSRSGFMRICAAHFFELVLYCLNDIE